MSRPESGEDNQDNQVNTDPNPEISENQELRELPVFDNVEFEAQQNRQGQVFYRSTSPDRKIIILAEHSPKPRPGESCVVRIIEDTKPEDPMSGKYIGVIEQTVDWTKVEKKAKLAEDKTILAREASREVYKKTGVTKLERIKTDIETILAVSDQPRVTGIALRKEREYQRDADELLGSADSPERTFVNFERDNLVKALHQNRELDLQRAQLLKEEASIMSRVDGEPSTAEQEALDEIRAAISEIDFAKDHLYMSSPEAFNGLHLKELKDYKRTLESGGRIVETPYVKQQAEDIVAHMRANKPVLVYGHLGTGKTELAMHVAREYIGKEALVISGSKHTSIAELYGHQILALDKLQKNDLDHYIQEVEGKYKQWLEANKDSSEEEKTRAHDRILQIYLTQFKSGTISNYFLGPIYRAMDEGRPIIIDEGNAIPHEVLISLNHILTRRVGDRLNVQQDSGKEVVVQKGYGVIMTGNLNQGQNRYVDRQDLDPAFLSRLYKLEHDYLPQKTEGALSVEAGPGNELFLLLLARTMDRNGSIHGPENTVRQLWRLAQAARITQDVFAGKAVNSNYYFQVGAGRSVPYMLKESVLSLRDLDNIITQWQKEGYKYEIDYYIYREFVGQSTTASDRAYLYQLLKDRFGFFIGPGWEQTPNYGSGGQVSSFDVPVPKNSPLRSEWIKPEQVVKAAFGPGPIRQNYPIKKSK